MTVFIIVSAAAWFLLKGLSRNDGRWTMDINELLRGDRDIIFMVEILFKETEEETLSQTDKYLEFREKDGDEWMFHSLTGQLESGTCTVSAADGENHKVGLHMDGDKLLQDAVYLGIAATG